MNKKVSLIIASIFLTLFLIGTISALDFGIDNYKSFIKDSKYGTIEIWDTGQTILFQPNDKKLVEYTLTDNTDQCLINCHAEGTATLYKKGRLFSDLEFKDNQGEFVNLEEDKILIWNTYEVEVDVNGYKEMRPREEWIEYNFENLDAGTYKWRVEGKKDIYQSVDWIGTSFGKELTDWAWWHNDWLKKQPVYINTTLLEKNNTSVLINVTYDADMQADFDDLRFVDNVEEREIGYWFYNNSYVASNAVQVWLNTGNLSASENRTYYMYYDNDAVKTTSDIEDAFWFGDDFNRTSVDYVNRYQSIVEGSYTIDHRNNGILNCSSIGNTNQYINAQINFTDVIFESRVQTNNVVPDNVITFFPAQPTPGSWTTEDYVQIQVNDFRLTIDGGAIFDGGAPVANTYYRFKFKFPLSGNSVINVTYDNLVQIPGVQASAVSGLKAGFPGFRSYDTNGYVDWWYARRYMSVEPTVTFGAERELNISVISSSPADYANQVYVQINLSCNFTTGESTERIENVTISVYDSGGRLDYINSEAGLSLISYNKTWANVELVNDTYIWGCYGLGSLGSNDTTANRTFTIYNVRENSQSYNNLTYETESETFVINYSSIGTQAVTASLFYEGVNKGAGTKTGDNTEMTFTKVVDIPTSNGTKEFYWEAYYGALDTIPSSRANQTVNNTEFNLKNVTSIYLNHTFLNITFLDEETLVRVGSRIDTSTTEYWLGDGTVTETLIYSNLTNMSEYNFCFTPASETMYNTRTFQYSAEGYPQRKYDDSTDLTNTTTHKTLYLLSSVDGIYSTIQVVDENGDIVVGADVTMERQFAGTWTIVGKETSDGAGAVTFWVNPDYDHRFTLEKTGCVVTTETIRPTQTTYTGTLDCGGVRDEIYIAPIEGIKYFLLPASGLLTTGQQNFSFQVASSKDNIVNAKFEIVNLSGYVLTSQTNACAAAGCTISKLYNVADAQNIKGRYYVDLGDGYILLEADAHWINVNITARDGTFKQFWLNLRGVFDEWHEEGEDITNTSDFNRIVFIFLFLAIGISVFNRITHFDSSNPGAFLIFLTAIVLMGSIAGFPDGKGFFYLDNFGASYFVNNYIILGYMLLITITHYVGVQLQKHR